MVLRAADQLRAQVERKLIQQQMTQKLTALRQLAGGLNVEQQTVRLGVWCSVQSFIFKTDDFHRDAAAGSGTLLRAHGRLPACLPVCLSVP